MVHKNSIAKPCAYTRAKNLTDEESPECNCVGKLMEVQLRKRKLCSFFLQVG